MELVTAKEAKKITIESREKKVLENIVLNINHLMRKGEDNYIIRACHLSGQEMKMLKHLGYEVCPYETNRKGTIIKYCISWS